MKVTVDALVIIKPENPNDLDRLYSYALNNNTTGETVEKDLVNKCVKISKVETTEVN